MRELDLSNCGPGLMADRVGVVPGLRSSAGESKMLSLLWRRYYLLESFTIVLVRRLTGLCSDGP